MEKTKKLVSVSEAADYWGVHHSTVLNWIRGKKVQALKLGAMYRLRPEVVEGFGVETEVTA